MFIDLKKAFDTVDYNILLSKLHYYGIRDLANNWFSSYLSSRKQFVSINGFSARTQSLGYGVTQVFVFAHFYF